MSFSNEKGKLIFNESFRNNIPIDFNSSVPKKAANFRSVRNKSVDSTDYYPEVLCEKSTVSSPCTSNLSLFKKKSRENRLNNLYHSGAHLMDENQFKECISSGGSENKYENDGVFVSNNSNLKQKKSQNDIDNHLLLKNKVCSNRRVALTDITNSTKADALNPAALIINAKNHKYTDYSTINELPTKRKDQRSYKNSEHFEKIEYSRNYSYSRDLRYTNSLEKSSNFGFNNNHDIDYNFERKNSHDSSIEKSSCLEYSNHFEYSSNFECSSSVKDTRNLDYYENIDYYENYKFCESSYRDDDSWSYKSVKISQEEYLSGSLDEENNRSRTDNEGILKRVNNSSVKNEYFESIPEDKKILPNTENKKLWYDLTTESSGGVLNIRSRTESLISGSCNDESTPIFNDSTYLKSTESSNKVSTKVDNIGVDRIVENEISIQSKIKANETEETEEFEGQSLINENVHCINYKCRKDRVFLKKTFETYKEDAGVFLDILIRNDNDFYITGHIKSESRVILIEWIFDVIYYYNLKVQCAFLALYILDVVCSIDDCVSADTYQLIAASGILVASKMVDVDPITTEEMVSMICDGDRTKEMLRIEQIIIISEDINLNAPTLYTYLELYVDHLNNAFDAIVCTKFVLGLSELVIMNGNVLKSFKLNEIALSICLLFLKYTKIVISDYKLKSLKINCRNISSCCNHLVYILRNRSNVTGDNLKRRFELYLQPFAEEFMKEYIFL